MTKPLPASSFAVVTGGSSGIGRALADRLAAAGASVLVASRRPAGRFEHRAVDLSCKDSVAALAQELLREGRPIDLLALNAGVHVPWRQLTTSDGEELHWQVNYLASFLLAQLLRPLCERSELKRVLYVASEAHRLASLPAARVLGFWYRYARSKEAAVTFFHRFQELHPELTVRVASPGYVDSEIHRGKGSVARRVERAWSRPRTPRAAAAELLRCFEPPGATAGGATCSAPGAASVYWDRGAPRSPSPRCLDAERAEALWRASLVSVRGQLPGARAPEWCSNYARNVQGFVAAIERPTSLEQLAAVVRRAAESGRAVKVVGERHSYNDSFHTSGSMVSLAHFDRVLRFDPEGGTITCEAGMSIGAVCEYLDRRGFALRYSGNFGKQTLAGALATGTHGYGRDGGVMSELVREVTLMGPDGGLTRAREERDLRSLRLSVGALGAIVDLTLAIEPMGPCRYQVACMRREAFNERLVPLARHHEYLRFVRHPFDTRHVLYVTIDRLPNDVEAEPAPYIADGEAVAPGLLVPLLRMPPVRKLAGRALAVSKQGYTLAVPFSSMLFIRSGVVESHPGLARVGAMALDRPDWLNMELAIPLERYGAFERLFAAEMPALSRVSRSRPYFTSRVVGAATSVVLAPNYGRDVVYCDVHADPTEPTSMDFLRRLERRAAAELSARPHWGKVFFAGHERLRELYPAGAFDEFAAAKRRLDPEGVFSSAFTRRALGV
jgi:FAD/FMN-containing dehydrogenase/NAD(P)-dependent dehydrogenase (short-subunit alcohol dehydrogenase family)